MDGATREYIRREIARLKAAEPQPQRNADGTFTLGHENLAPELPRDSEGRFLARGRKPKKPGPRASAYAWMMYHARLSGTCTPQSIS